MVNVQELPEPAKSSVWSYQEFKRDGFNSQKIIFAKECNKSAFISPLLVGDVSKHDHCK